MRARAAEETANEERCRWEIQAQDLMAAVRRLGRWPLKKKGAEHTEERELAKRACNALNSGRLTFADDAKLAETSMGATIELLVNAIGGLLFSACIVPKRSRGAFSVWLTGRRAHCLRLALGHVASAYARSAKAGRSSSDGESKGRLQAQRLRWDVRLLDRRPVHIQKDFLQPAETLKDGVVHLVDALAQDVDGYAEIVHADPSGVLQVLALQ